MADPVPHGSGPLHFDGRDGADELEADGALCERIVGREHLPYNRDDGDNPLPNRTQAGSGVLEFYGVCNLPLGIANRPRRREERLVNATPVSSNAFLWAKEPSKGAPYCPTWRREALFTKKEK